MIFKHWLHLARRSRQQSYRDAFILDEQAGSAAIGIWQHFCFFDHHRLTGVPFRHYMTKTTEPLAQLGENCLVKQEATAKRSRGNFTRNIILGWAKASSSYHHLRTAARIADGLFKPRVIVAYYRL